MERRVELAVVGGGPAGMAVALEARKNGVREILILERDVELGGILQQCIHDGFGLHIFKDTLTGPEYAERFMDEIGQEGIEVLLNTTVLEITQGKELVAINPSDGLMRIRAGAIALAMGCRERTRGALNIPGTRPAGVFPAGCAQRFVNIEGYMPGKNIVILGSGDIGLIMARRMTLEGASVKAVCELMPYSGGLTRNIVQCLEDFDIPLLLSHTVVQIHGKERLEGVTIARVDGGFKPVPGTEAFIECDTLLLSVGLIPENELSRTAKLAMDAVTGGCEVNQRMESSVRGIFVCGNVLHVHDLVDNVTVESRLAGAGVAEYLKTLPEGECFHNHQSRGGTDAEERVLPGKGLRYVVPQIFSRNVGAPDGQTRFYFRSDNVYQNPEIIFRCGDRILYKKRKQKVSPGEMEEILLENTLLREGFVGESFRVSLEG